MSAIRIAKGYPISLLITVNQDGTPVNINDGSWTYDVNLNYQTADGPSPFSLTTVPTGNSVTVSIANTQTSLLDHLNSGYVLVVDCSKNDGSAYIKNEIPVNVTNGL